MRIQLPARMVTEMTDAGWGAQEWLTLAAVLVPTFAVGFTAWLNSRAHTGITKRIADVDVRSVARDEAHRATLESIARDVSFMAGRQAERDKGK